MGGAQGPGVGEDFRRARDEVRGLAQEFAGISEDLRGVFRGEVELARAEMGEQKTHATQAVVYGAVAAVFGLLMLAWVSLTITFALDLAMPLWAAALIVTAGLALIAAVGGALAYGRVKRITGVPRRAMTAFREDVEWARHELKSSMSSNGNGTRSGPG